MKATAPLISIITLNYNQTEVTCDFLESTRKLHYPNYEILVCDMASVNDPTERIVSGNYPHTRVLVNKENLGFSGGNNWGMRQANGDYYFIVNNDTILKEDILDKLLIPFTKDPFVGVSCPKIMYYDQPDTIQYAGFYPMNPFTGRAKGVGTLEKDRGQYDEGGPTNGAHGCAMLVNRQVTEKTGMFPEKFFLYYEEWDWSHRILQSGYKIWYTPEAVIYHKESVSVGKENPLKTYYHTRNRILYIRRNSNLFQQVVFGFFFIFFSTPKALFNYLKKGQLKQARYFLKGLAWNFYSSSQSPV